MKIKVFKIARIVLVLLILSTLAYAFYQSSLPTKESVQESNKVGEIIEEVIPQETKPGEYIQKNLRKLAHIAEFFGLGLWTSLYVVFFSRKKGIIAAVIPFGMISALLDETVQIFSKRGASVKDVWIDMLGYTAAVAVVAIVFFTVFFLKRSTTQKRV